MAFWERTNQKRSSRPTSGYVILVYVAAIAILMAAFDGLIESGQLRSLIGNKLAVEESLSASDENSTESIDLHTRYATIPIDHDDPSRGSFQNRYWINDEFYQQGGPVFIYDTGETDASPQVERMLLRPTSFMAQLLEEFHGLGILWEHRYYGESQPFPKSANSTANDFQFLTLNQSLADLPYFSRNFQLESHPHSDLRPTSTPWIMVECSYSGTRAAFSRIKYPETFFAAFAESTVVHLEVGVYGYDTELRQSLVDHGYGNCSKDVHALFEYIDTQLDSPGTASSIKRQYLGPEADQNSNVELASAVNSVYQYFKGWGIQDGKPSVAALCDYLEFNPILDTIAPDSGLSEYYNPRFLSDRLASWPELVRLVNKNFNTTYGPHNGSATDACDLSMFEDQSDGNLAWGWQQCSELGLFVSHDTGPHSLMSRYLSLEHRISNCRELFGMNSTDLLSDITRQVERTNQQFGGRSTRPSNVFWTTGQYDTYRSCSPLSRSELEIGPSSVLVSQDIPTCNTSTGHDSLFGLIIPEKGHCEVIGRNSTEALQARRMFADALHEWLECF